MCGHISNVLKKEVIIVTKLGGGQCIPVAIHKFRNFYCLVLQEDLRR